MNKKRISKKLIYIGIGTVATGAAIATPIVILNNNKSQSAKKLLNLNNSKTTNESLEVIKKRAQETILATSPTTSLLPGTVISTLVKDNYEKRLFGTLKLIELAKTKEAVKSILKNKTFEILNYGKSLENAIIHANREFKRKKILALKSNYEIEINQIIPTSKLVKGAANPKTENDNFIVLKNIAIATIRTLNDENDLKNYHSKIIIELDNSKNALNKAIEMRNINYIKNNFMIP